MEILKVFILAPTLSYFAMLILKKTPIAAHIRPFNVYLISILFYLTLEFGAWAINFIN